MNRSLSFFVVFVIFTVRSWTDQTLYDQDYYRAMEWLDVSDESVSGTEVLSTIFSVFSLKKTTLSSLTVTTSGLKSDTSDPKKNRADFFWGTGALKVHMDNFRRTVRDKLDEAWEDGKKRYLSKGPTPVETETVLKDRFRPFRLRLLNKAGYQRAIGNRATYVQNLSRESTLTWGLSWAPLELKDPNSQMKLDYWDFGLGFRKYFHQKFFFQSNLGFVRYDPNEAFRDWYRQKNQVFGASTTTYFSVGLGAMVIKKLPVIERPLILSCTYTFADDFYYPSVNPSGETGHFLEGFKVGVSIRYRL